jgi:hypothetical protein
LKKLILIILHSLSKIHWKLLNVQSGNHWFFYQSVYVIKLTQSQIPLHMVIYVLIDSDIAIVWLMWTVWPGPKKMTLSGFYCIFKSFSGNFGQTSEGRPQHLHGGRHLRVRIFRLPSSGNRCSGQIVFKYLRKKL